MTDCNSDSSHPHGPCMPTTHHQSSNQVASTAYTVSHKAQPRKGVGSYLLHSFRRPVMQEWAWDGRLGTNGCQSPTILTGVGVVVVMCVMHAACIMIFWGDSGYIVAGCAPFVGQGVIAYQGEAGSSHELSSGLS